MRRIPTLLLSFRLHVERGWGEFFVGASGRYFSSASISIS
jgi:hypothetical protein